MVEDLPVAATFTANVLQLERAVNGGLARRKAEKRSPAWWHSTANNFDIAQTLGFWCWESPNPWEARRKGYSHSIVSKRVSYSCNPLLDTVTPFTSSYKLTKKLVGVVDFQDFPKKLPVYLKSCHNFIDTFKSLLGRVLPVSFDQRHARWSLKAMWQKQSAADLWICLYQDIISVSREWL